MKIKTYKVYQIDIDIKWTNTIQNHTHIQYRKEKTGPDTAYRQAYRQDQRKSSTEIKSYTYFLQLKNNWRTKQKNENICIRKEIYGKANIEQQQKKYDLWFMNLWAKYDLWI